MKEVEFYQRGEEITKWMLKKQPVAATQMGLHDWDDKLGYLCLESIAQDLKKIKEFYKEIKGIDVSDFNKDAKIDHTLFCHILKSIIKDTEKDRDHHRNPNLYLNTILGGIMTLIMKDFAPLPVRLKSMLGRLEDIPEVIKQARSNLRTEEIPPVWIDVALQQLSMASGLFEGLLPQIAVNVPDLEEEINKASKKAVKLLQEFAKYLEKEIKPRANGNFAVGEDRFNELLKENHMVDYNAEELLKKGWQIFKDTKRQMNELSNEINSDKSLKEIMEEAKADHPSAEGLLDAYNRAMKASRKYIIEHDIVSIPEGEELNVIETPPYLRPVIPYAAYMQPGIFEDKLQGLFLVTPVNPASSKEEQEEKLKGHYNSKLPVTALHEGYPGHHLQLVWSVISGKTLRKMGTYLSTLFIEGWAFYCEEMMEEMGYIDSPVQRLSRLSDQLWRAARIILDVNLHCHDMKVEEAVDFLVERCQLEYSNALAEVRRYTSSPTQPQSYLMGKIKIMEIINEYKEQNPEKSLKEIHNSIMACGSLPPKLMKKQLLG